ncbi:hypothetical protein OIA_05151, partial [Enterococcus faecium EnGen0018]
FIYGELSVYMYLYLCITLKNTINYINLVFEVKLWLMN